MMFFTPIRAQLRTFIKYHPSCLHEDWDQVYNTLYLFIRLSGKKDVSDINDEDIEMFTEYMANTSTPYQTYEALKIVRYFLRYYNFETIMKKRRVGRPYNLVAIKQAKQLRDAGYSYREIAEKMKVSLSLVYRFANRKVQGI